MPNQADALSYAVRFPVLAKYFGQLCLVVAMLSLFPLAVSVFYGETQLTYRYGAVILLLAGGGFLLGRIQAPRNVQVNEAMVLTAAMFLIIPALMSFPMMASGLSFVDALFEAISGSTTTGLSMVTHVQEMSPTFLFARSWMQWYGGLGIMVFSLALLLRPGATSKSIAVAESGSEDLVGGTRAHARRVLIIYSLLTAIGILTLLGLGAGPYNAVLYSLSSVSTGGFAPQDASLAALDGKLIQFSVILLCLSAAIPLSFYHGLYKKGRRPVADVLQLRAILVLGMVASLLLGLCLALIQGVDWLDALHHAPLLAFSAQSTAGFTSMDLAQLDPASKLILVLSMAVGGGVGSTAGGLKILRLLIIIRVVQVVLRRTCTSRHAVVTPRIAGERLEDRGIQEALLIVLLFAAVILFSWLPFVMLGYDPMDSLFEVVSATGTVGLSVGLIDSGMPVLLKAVLCLDMLLGRLEILAWLVMVYPRTWIGRRL